ncbi:terpene synthase family protein [Streptomyces sp. NPDC001635]
MPKPLLFDDTHDKDTAALATYTAPSYGVPWTGTLHPDHTHAERETLAWARRWDLLTSDAARQRITDICPGLFAAWFCPRTDRRGVTLKAKWAIWLWLWDDLFDDGPLGRDPAACHIATLQLDEHALTDPPTPPDDPQLTLPLARALADLWGDFYDYSPAACRSRFPDNTREYLGAVAQETANRSAETLPTLDEYLHLRVINAATRPSIDVLEGLQQADIPDELHRGLYGELRDMHAELWTWSNDTYTVRKDLHYHNPHNLVLVLRHAQNLSLQEAADQAARMVEQRVRDCVRVADRLRRLTDTPGDPHAQHKEQILRGIRVLEDASAGYLRWQETTARYQRTSGFITPPPST